MTFDIIIGKCEFIEIDFAKFPVDFAYTIDCCELGEVVYVDLPSVGDTFSKEDSIGAVESTKAASDIYTPVSGEIVEVNEALDAEPNTVNNDAFGEGWICKIKLDDASELDELMDAEAYTEFCK